MPEPIRPMTTADLGAVGEVWHHAFGALRSASGEPLTTRTADEIATDLARHAHLLESDPGASFVAEIAGVVVGLAHGHRTGSTFVLSMLAVHPDFQDRGLGSALFEVALASANSCSRQIIFSSSDPRALHRYVSAGFALHPTVRVTPRPTGPDRPRSAYAAPEATPELLGLIGELDGIGRGAPRPDDISYWLGAGQLLLCDPEGGYALLGEDRLTALGARSETIATRLFAAVLAGEPDGTPRAAGWITASQQWAITEANRQGAELRVQGAVLVRGAGCFATHYLPNGLFG